MEPSLDQSLLQALRDCLGEAPESFRPLAGATSSELYRFRLRRGDAVLRRILPARWDTAPEELIDREFAILTALQDCRLPAPAPIARLPDNALVMSHLVGNVVLPASPTTGWLDDMARMLSRIHAADVVVPYRFESWNQQRSHPPPAWWQDTELWAEAQALVSLPPDAPRVFLHRDYHPANLLWVDGRISGVVDWINACMGPRGVDVAHCRLNLALMYGQPAADAFLQCYAGHVPGYEHDPFWDVDDALGFGPDVQPYPPWAEFGLTGLTTEVIRSRLEAFVQAAVSR
ncbi:MAG: phosphotransferase family protein [Pseudomonadales bacterium]